MSPTHLYAKLAVAAAAIFFAVSATASMLTPKAQLEDTMERIMAVTKTFESEQDFINNKPKLREIIMPRFDFAEMARRSLGSDWGRVAGREDEFVAAFIQFAEGSYMNTLGSYRGEKMTYGREQIDQDFAQVETQVWGSSGGATPIVYKMRQIAGDWKVYDVVIDDVSLVANFRSQFGRILKTASVDELMRKLRAKAPQS